MPSTLQLRLINAVIPTATTAITSTDHNHVNFRNLSLLQDLVRQLSLPADTTIPETVFSYHNHHVGPKQCCSAVVQIISAPVAVVWSVVRRFDNPQAYKHFLKSCDVILGDGDVGTLREVHVVSGLPAAYSTERLEILDEERHVISFSVVGGEHRLRNYRSVTTLHPTEGGAWTAVVESYVVDVPTGNTREETFGFVDTIVRCNLQSLAKIAEKMTKTQQL